MALQCTFKLNQWVNFILFVNNTSLRGISLKKKRHLALNMQKPQVGEP